MKHLLKPLVLIVIVLTLVLNLSIDSLTGGVSISKAKASYALFTTGETTAKWKKELVYCVNPVTEEAWGYKYGCFKGDNSTCVPTDCEPFPTTAR